MTLHKPLAIITREVLEPLASLLQPHCHAKVHDSIEPLLERELLPLSSAAQTRLSAWPTTR